MSNDSHGPKSVVSGTQVERMLKGIDKRIAELEKELEQLRKQRYACEVLLAPDKAEIPHKSVEKASNGQKVAARKRQRSGVHQKISELLKSEVNGLTIQEITQKLKEVGELTDSPRPESTVYVAISRHAELFKKTEDGGRWCLINREN